MIHVQFQESQATVNCHNTVTTFNSDLEVCCVRGVSRARGSATSDDNAAPSCNPTMLESPAIASVAASTDDDASTLFPAARTLPHHDERPSIPLAPLPTALSFFE